MNWVLEINNKKTEYMCIGALQDLILKECILQKMASPMKLYQEYMIISRALSFMVEGMANKTTSRKLITYNRNGFLETCWGKKKISEN